MRGKLSPPSLFHASDDVKAATGTHIKEVMTVLATGSGGFERSIGRIDDGPWRRSTATTDCREGQQAG